ncbi:hypothetical protein M0D69_04150 [Caballeronia sp. SEWSISQ10-4 2]|uniref:hypothetical protein n=1 Tax=Caballeronia sp. SEWSISQ10-4 2 TaxID=2937438 RepID=UPI00264A854B|nr:hypothetical protein [Caballeronia sp. SEWSISQ10-4 2]MDN7177214.1 hypothetical protein [Caballeronia sp. SEWSISQ10-4 2]
MTQSAQLDSAAAPSPRENASEASCDACATAAAAIRPFSPSRSPVRSTIARLALARHRAAACAYRRSPWTH